MPPKSAAPSRELPLKEASLFKEVLNLYEARLLKKGLKAADTILKKFPNHGETLSMKGLILTHLGKREEGLELVRLGIRNDLASHIVWHVFGLIQKGEKKYEEALKSYTQALKFDKENLNILRDAAHLQTQLRLFDNLVETRHLILRLRPTLRAHWIGLAVAYHLNGNLQETRKVLEMYESTLKNIPDYDVEHSEILLYHIRVLEDLDDIEGALSILDINAKSRAITDRIAIMEYRARLLTKLKHDSAEQAWQALIEQNPDCLDYYRNFLSNRGINLAAVTDDNREAALKVLEDFSAQHPRANAPRRLALDVAVGDKFTALAEPYLLAGLDKGVPSVFSDVKSLYRDHAKRDAIGQLVEGRRDALVGENSADPTEYLWTLYFLAQHRSKLGMHTEALKLLDTAIEHTATLPELLMFKARVLKRCGDHVGAARWMDEARILDLQDRFLNTKCAKYRLRAGRIEEASEILGLFTKKDAPSPGADLEEMQSLFYLTEEADAFARKGNLGMALKRYTAVQKVFDDFEDDQFDFHGYSLRKFTINIYLNLITWEDQLRSHPIYVYTALAFSRIAVRVHDNPSIVAALNSTANLSSSQRKALQKAKKAQKVQEEAKKAATKHNTNEDQGLEPPPPKDEDPEGTKLLQSPDLLERSAKLLEPLAKLANDNVDVWIASYDVAVRRKKYVQAVKALNQAKALDADHPELHIRLVHFKQHTSSWPQPPPEPIGSVATSSITKLLPDELSLEVFNSQYLQQHSTDARAILAAAKVQQILGTPREDVESAALAVLNPEASLSIQAALSVLAFLQDIQSPRLDEFKSKCSERFELSTAFLPENELASQPWKADPMLGGQDQTKAEEEGLI